MEAKTLDGHSLRLRILTLTFLVFARLASPADGPSLVSKDTPLYQGLILPTKLRASFDFPVGSGA